MFIGSLNLEFVIERGALSVHKVKVRYEWQLPLSGSQNIPVIQAIFWSLARCRINIELHPRDSILSCRN